MTVGEPEHPLAPEKAAIDLYWLPLGAGGHSVKWNGRAWEALQARRERRLPLALYHAALEIRLDGERWTVEQAPATKGPPDVHGVVAQGPVGARWAGRLRIFRYEVRLWRDGEIPDVAEAVASPRRLSDDPGIAGRVLKAVPRVPRLVWGRDEIGAGEMWNSNAVIAWSLGAAGLDAGAVAPPDGGRAPGWRAGAQLAERQG